MTKLLFQFPKGNVELSEESKTNALFAMLGVVAIFAMISLVFLFQLVLVAPGFGEPSGFIVYKASELCDDPGLIVTDNNLVNFLKEKRQYKCSHSDQDAWCCYPPN